MKHSGKILFLLFASVYLASCGQEKSAVSIKVNKSDYSVYSDYWYDKTVAEIGHGKIEVESKVHDFDIMPPGMEGSHQFEIKNTGDQPLCLMAGPKTCKCTGLKILDREIAPGETGKVEVKWETVALAKSFKHSASVYTNDSEHRQVKFTIKGRVGVESNVWPENFLLGRFLPDMQSKTEAIVVYSDQWKDFEIKNLKTSFGDQATVQVKPINDVQKNEPQLKRSLCNKSIELTLKNPVKRGAVRGVVSFSVVGPDKTIDHEIVVDAKVVRRIRLEETKSDVLTPSGIVQMRRVPRQTGKKEKLLLTVLDEDKNLKIKKLNVKPDFVEIRLKPLNSKTSKHGMYTLELIIPENQKQANFNKVESFGNVEIEFDHPRVEPLNLKLDFYIL